ncbi:FKBP-type peptidyl-prolyl cis-trans isomerase [Enterobacter kobei]|uniref:FKBP-type peptidyl-prolyl cis-trans isomerase n=1 Tax=Enterobacter kobei TaxID=208224 RepID=UPI003CEC42FF
MYPTINTAHNHAPATGGAGAGLFSSLRLRGAGTCLLACVILTAVAGRVQASPPATAAEPASPVAEKAEVQALRQELEQQGAILQKLLAQQASSSSPRAQPSATTVVQTHRPADETDNTQPLASATTSPAKGDVTAKKSANEKQEHQPASLPPQTQPSAAPVVQTHRPADETENTQPAASAATSPAKGEITAKQSTNEELAPGGSSVTPSPAMRPAQSGVNPVITTTQNEAISSTSPSATTPAEAENTAAQSVSSTDQIFLQDESGRRAYASGVSLAYDMKQSLAQQKALGIILPEALLMSGLQDALSGRPLRMADQDIQSTLSALNTDFSTRLQKRRTEEEARGREFRADFRRKKGAFSDAGSLYLIDEKGTGRLHTSDMASLLVTGRLPDGTVFDGSGDAGRVRKVKVGAMLPAIAIGLQKVGAGGHLTVVVPPEKGYGDMGLPPSIPGGATLIFDIMVKGVNEAG